MKKIISLILSLSMVFVGAAFVSAEEIAVSANHEIELLQNLDILSGYEDGSLRLEDTISRAEAAKMIVAMINKITIAEGRKGATQFNDVPAEHWASGFINVGVSDKFISGKSATKFDPESNVKYNEIVKMIISCLGYEEYAQFYGGYPTGYVAIADAEGITKGCSMDGEAAATRGIVAQLIYNALNTPIIQYKGMQHSAIQGGFVPNIEKQDGEESKYFKSLLTEKFNAYVVSGTVTKNKKSEPALDADEVEISITKTEKYEVADDLPKLVNVGNTPAADYLNTYVDMVIQKNEDDEYTILNIAPSGKNTIVESSLSLVDEDKAIDNYIWLFDSEDDAKSTKYKLESNYKLFVNGEEKNDIDKYIVNNKVGRITLTDTYKSEDGYDIISVDYFETALVRSTSAKKIYTTNTEAYGTSLAIDVDTLEENEIVINVYLGDEPAAIEDIVKDDILSIRYANGFYDIYISRASAEGRVSAKDPDEMTVTIDGYKYEFINENVFNSIKLGSEYKLRLDLFERVYDVEELASSTKYAIVLKTITSSNWDNTGVRLYLSNGTIKNYELSNKIENYNSLTNATKEDLVGRVVSYSVNSAGKINKIEKIDGTAKTADFDERNSKIGNIILNNSTVVIDASEYKTSADLEVASVNTFINDVEYSIYAYGEPSKIDNSYPFVIIMNGQGSYTEDTRFAVVTKAPYRAIKEDGEEGYSIEVLYEGVEDVQTLFIDEDTTVETINIGDVIVMRKNADDDIKEIEIIFDGKTCYAPERWDLAWNTDKDMETSLVYGPVIEHNGRKYLAQIKDGKTYLDLEPTKGVAESEGAVLDIITTKDTLVYVYDKNASKNDRFFVGTEDDIVTTQIEHLLGENDEAFTITWGDEKPVVNALAKIVDGVVTDIFVIIEKE